MPKPESQFRSDSTISCCHYCVPPKRHTACWDHCPEYLAQKAANELRKAQRIKKAAIVRGLNAQRRASVNRTRKGKPKI